MKSLTFALTFLVVLLAWGIAVERREGEGARRNIAAARYTADSLKARLAEAILTQAPARVDTVRQIITRVKTLRDSVISNVTDTLQILRYVWITDSLRAECEKCAALHDTIRERYGDKERANDTYVSLLLGDIKRKDKLLEYGPRVRVQADALKGFVSGDWRLGADADMRLFGRVRLMGRAEQWLVHDQGPELFGGVRVTF